MKLWPPVSCVDIDCFLKTSNCVGLTRVKAFNQTVVERHSAVIIETGYKKLIMHNRAVTRRQFIPNNRRTFLPRKLWVVEKKESREITLAYSSVAG